MAPSANTLRGKFLAEATRKDVENWDDDFGDEIEDITLRVSISSAGGGDGPFYQRSTSIEAPECSPDAVFQQVNPPQAFSLTELGEEDLDAEFNDTYDVSTMKQPPEVLRGVSGTVSKTLSKASGTLKTYGESDEDDWGEFTVKAESKSRKRLDDNSLISGALFGAPAKLTSRPTIVDDDFDGDFDLDTIDDLASKLRRVNVISDAAGDELDELGGIRTSSRLSTTSSYSTSTYEESDTGGEGNDFFSGFDEMLKNQTAVDLQARLRLRQQEMEDLAKREQELLTAGKRYDTVKSGGSVNSVKFVEQTADNDEDDLLEGFDVSEDVDAAFANTINKNIVLRQHGSSARPMPRSPSKRGQKHPLQASSSSRNLRRSASRPFEVPTSSGSNPGLRIKQSMPALRQPGGPANDLSNIQKLRRITSRQQHISTSQSSSAISSRASGDQAVDSHTPYLPPQVPSSRLRNVQSMHNLAQAKPSQSGGAHRNVRLKTKNIYGDGSELDLLDELTINPSRERKYTIAPRSKSGHRANDTTVTHRPLEEYVESSGTIRAPRGGGSTVRAHTKSSLLKQHRSPNGKKRSSRKGPGLIQNLGYHKMPQIQGEMQFNPKKLIWEGNDIELKKFDSVTPKTRGLISFISSKGVEVNGDMVFDPQRMCWISMVDEDNNDPFEGIDDLDVSVSSNSTRTSGVGSSSSGNSVSVGEFVVGDEFRTSGEFLKTLQEEDDRWHRKTKGWFPPNEPFDREFLYEIRNMVVQRTS